MFLYKITTVDVSDPAHAFETLTDACELGGFVVDLRITSYRKEVTVVKVNNIRHYSKDRRMGGGDWRRFNDLVNDWLDGEGMEADVQSSSFLIRAQGRRRVTYKGGDYHGIVSKWRDCA